MFFHRNCPLVGPMRQGEALGWWDRLCRGLLSVGALLFLTPLVLQLTPLRWVVTPSLPLGFYWETQEPIVRGAYVHFCLAEPIAAFGFAQGYLRSGICPGLYAELLKVVAAVAGDVVELNEGVVINGHLIPHAPRYATDSQGRPQQVWIATHRFVVPPGQVFVLSTFHLRSWDSRYFGCVPVQAIRGTARPLWVWP